MCHSIAKLNAKLQTRLLARSHWVLSCVLLCWAMIPLSLSAAIDRAAIASGGEFSCALLTDGSVQCWGSNGDGQLGDGTTTDRSRPGAVDGLAEGVVQIATGAAHACAVLQDETVKCWGRGDSGQLGDGGTANSSTPVPVDGLSGVVEVDAGLAHTCARLADGAVECWGSQDDGRLGNGVTSGTSTSPVSVTDLDGAAPSTSATAISVGDAHTCAVREDETAVCWGSNSSGRLGDDSDDDRPTPVSVTGLAVVAEVAAGGSHSCARLSSGAVECWGSQNGGRLGNNQSSSNSLTAVPVTGIDGSSDDASAIAISSGGSNSCALMADQTLRCWGDGTNGRNGDGTTTDALTPSKVLASGSDQTNDPVFSNAAAVSVGGRHGCALVEGGGVSCWGEGNFGQLGDGEEDNQFNPVAVLSSGTASDNPVPLSAIVAGFPNALSISVDGSNEALADGDETVTVSVAVSDGFSDPVAGQSVFFTATPSAGVEFATNPVVTGADGSATTNISATEAGDITITAFPGTSAGGAVSDAQVVTFNSVPSPPEPDPDSGSEPQPPAEPFIPEPVPVNSPWALALLVLLMLGWGLRWRARRPYPTH